MLKSRCTGALLLAMLGVVLLAHTRVTAQCEVFVRCLPYPALATCAYQICGTASMTDMQQVLPCSASLTTCMCVYVLHLHAGDMEECSHQQGWAQAHMEQHDATAAAVATLKRSSSNPEEDLFWCGNAGQLAAAELFSIPAAFQPRVKDLTAPDAPCLLSMDSNLSEVSTPLAAPMAVPSEEQHTVSVPAGSDCLCTHDSPPLFYSILGCLCG